MEKNITISGSIFDALEADEGIAAQLKIKAELFDVINLFIKKNDFSQEAAAELMGVQRSRISDIKRGKLKGFTIDYLLSMAARAGLSPLQVIHQENAA